MVMNHDRGGPHARGGRGISYATVFCVHANMNEQDTTQVTTVSSAGRRTGHKCVCAKWALFSRVRTPPGPTFALALRQREGAGTVGIYAVYPTHNTQAPPTTHSLLVRGCPFRIGSLAHAIRAFVRQMLRQEIAGHPRAAAQLACNWPERAQRAVANQRARVHGGQVDVPTAGKATAVPVVVVQRSKCASQRDPLPAAAGNASKARGELSGEGVRRASACQWRPWRRTA